MDLENYTNINIFKKVYENREVMSSTNMIEQPHHMRLNEGPAKEHASGFNPYVNNQGTTIGKLKLRWKEEVNQVLIILAIAGKDFCVVAADTRISQGYSILARDYSKTTRLTDKCVITSGGMVADIETLHKQLISKVKTYER